MDTRHKFQNDCAKDVLSAMMVKHGKLGKGNNNIFSAVVLDYAVTEQFTGGQSDSGLTQQIPSFFYTSIGGGVHRCADYKTLQDTEINLEDFEHNHNPKIDGEHYGAIFWKENGNKHLKKPLFIADIFAYGGKHNRFIEIWMVDGEHLITDDMIEEIISWHYNGFSEIALNCISSDFILAQDKNMDASKFMKLCLDNCVKKIPEYKPEVKTAASYTRETVIPGGMDIRGFFKSKTSRMK